MSYLESISGDDLRRALRDVEGRTPTLRVVVGINYKRGVSPTTLADWYDVSRTTIYHWLERLERLTDESAADPLHDADRPGRPSKLSPEQRTQLVEVLAGGPSVAGYDANDWTPTLARRYIREAFDVEYTTRHVRDLLDELS